MSSKKLYRWYKEALSGFDQAQSSGEVTANNIVVRQQGVLVEIAVPIMEEKNLGSQMAVDEKNINGTAYTILSNRQTNKIALMAATLKTQHLVEITKGFALNKRMQVKSLSRDMASYYDWFARQVFMNAYHVIDKFHVLKNCFDQLQSIRIRYRQQELSRRRLARQEKKKYIETELFNGDTVLQLLARSRGLLFLLPNQWSEQQKQRAKILFEQYPLIKQAYHLTLKLRKWFTPPKGSRTYKKTLLRKKVEIENLIKEFNKTGIDEMMNTAHLLNTHMGQILNYFIAKETNAKAEALNQNIQRFINVNYGARNTEFFLYRIKTHFA